MVLQAESQRVTCAARCALALCWACANWTSIAYSLAHFRPSWGGGVRVEDENRLPAALNHDLDMQADLSFPRETGPLPENSLRVQV